MVVMYSIDRSYLHARIHTYQPALSDGVVSVLATSKYDLLEYGPGRQNIATPVLQQAHSI